MMKLRILKSHNHPKKHRVHKLVEYRTQRYRVFRAYPYFDINLKKEIEWHKNHLKKLYKYKEKPHLFHKEIHDSHVDIHRERHYKEHVIDSIPFHEKFVDDHEKRLKTISSLIPEKPYKKIVAISMVHGGTPDYFVYDKETKRFFFLSSHYTEKTKKWIDLVEKKYKLSTVFLLKK